MSNEVLLTVNPDTTASWDIPLVEGTTVVGCDPSLSHPIQHDSVSSQHAAFELRGGRVMFQDLGSTNGSFTEGRPLAAEELRMGQVIQLGEVQVRVVARSVSAAIPTARLRVSKTTETTASTQPSAPVLASLSAESSEAPPAGIPTGPGPCKYHPKTAAGYYCGKCDKSYCGLCVSPRGGAQHCRACGGKCVELDTAAVLEPEVERSFYERLPGFFAYPFRGNGVWMMIAGSVLFVLFDLASRFSWFISIGYVGFLVLYSQQIIQASAQGEEKGPEWPELSGGFLGSLLPAFLKYLGTTLVCLLPGLLMMFYGGREVASALEDGQSEVRPAAMVQSVEVGQGNPPGDGNGAGGADTATVAPRTGGGDEAVGVKDPGATHAEPGQAKQGEVEVVPPEVKKGFGWMIAGGVLLGLGALYLPMALLGVAMFDSVAAVSPTLVMPSILRVVLPYLVTLLLLGFCLGVSWGVNFLMVLMIDMPVVPGLVASVPGLYLLTVAMHCLGMLYYTHREKLGWF